MSSGKSSTTTSGGTSASTTPKSFFGGLLTGTNVVMVPILNIVFIYLFFLCIVPALFPRAWDTLIGFTFPSFGFGIDWLICLACCWLLIRPYFRHIGWIWMCLLLTSAFVRTGHLDWAIGMFRKEVPKPCDKSGIFDPLPGYTLEVSSCTPVSFTIPAGKEIYFQTARDTNSNDYKPFQVIRDNGQIVFKYEKGTPIWTEDIPATHVTVRSLNKNEEILFKFFVK